MAARAGYPVLVKTATAVGGSYSTIAGIDNVTFGPSKEELDVSEMSATVLAEKILMGLNKGSATIKGAYRADDTNGQVVLRAAQLAATEEFFQFIFDDSQGAGSKGYKVRGYVTGFEVSTGVRGRVDFSMTIRFNGTPGADNASTLDT